MVPPMPTPHVVPRTTWTASRPLLCTNFKPPTFITTTVRIALTASSGATAVIVTHRVEYITCTGTTRGPQVHEACALPHCPKT